MAPPAAPSPPPYPAMRSHEDVLAEFAAAEQGDGWLARCADRRRYVALNRQFVDALAESLRALGRGPVTEVCAGDGALAAALRGRGVDVTATDAAPPARLAGPVERRAAGDALCSHRPRVVLGSFVPVDAGVDDLVFGCDSVAAYVVLDARLWGEFGSARRCGRAGWGAVPLADVTRWMISRHDVWLGHDVPPLRRGEAWQFSRLPGAPNTQPVRPIAPDAHPIRP